MVRGPEAGSAVCRVLSEDIGIEDSELAAEEHQVAAGRPLEAAALAGLPENPQHQLHLPRIVAIVIDLP
jgi:hypothetical protein